MDYTDCMWILSIMSIKNAKYKLKNNIMIKPEILRFLWDIVVFRLVAYLLNMICLMLQLFSKFHIFEFSYKFDTVLYQFLEIGASDITFMGRDQELKWLAYSLYPLSFFLYYPFKGSIQQIYPLNNYFVYKEFRISYNPFKLLFIQ